MNLNEPFDPSTSSQEALILPVAKMNSFSLAGSTPSDPARSVYDRTIFDRCRPTAGGR
jgi:hypothetical protein